MTNKDQFMSELCRRDVAEKIWDIAKISSHHGNALIDLIGYDAYKKVMDLRRENHSQD